LVYELRAVVVHLDKFGFSHFGHYVTYVRCAVPSDTARSQWYVLDDSVVTEVSEQQVMSQQAYLLIYAAAATLPPVLKRASSSAAASQGGNDATAKVQVDSGPVRCRGRGGEVCSFFACSSDGLCTRCFQAENGTLPTEAINNVSEAQPTEALATQSAKSSSKPATGGPPSQARATVAKAPVASSSGGKSKKVGANDQCPCGSGRKYKKCHGAA